MLPFILLDLQMGLNFCDCRIAMCRWFCPPLYFLQPTVWPRLDEFLRTSKNDDAPGYFIDFLSRKESVYAFKLNGSRLDIGSIDSYREAQEALIKESCINLP